jgi:hypothetical protein
MEVLQMPKARARKAGAKKTRRKLPRCHRCDRPIRVPKGWSQGAAVRRHYWAKHREVMQAGTR